MYLLCVCVCACMPVCVCVCLYICMYASASICSSVCPSVSVPLLVCVLVRQRAGQVETAVARLVIQVMCYEVLGGLDGVGVRGGGG